MRRWPVLVVVLVLVVAGCAGGDDEAATGGVAQTSTGGGDAGEGGSAGAGGDVTAGDEVEVVSASQLVGAAEREIIHTAELEVAAGDVDGAAEAARDLARSASGFVFSEDADLEGDTRIELVLKVPPARFDATLAALAELGDLRRQVVATDDVTEQVVDLDARLATARASADRLRAILPGAPAVPDVVAVEQALAQREAEVASLEAQLRSLRGKADLATITLILTEPAEAAVSDDIPGFVPGLRTGVVALVNVAQVTATVVGFVLPFALVLGPLAAVAVLVRRRGHRTGGGEPERAA